MFAKSVTQNIKIRENLNPHLHVIVTILSMFAIYAFNQNSCMTSLRCNEFCVKLQCLILDNKFIFPSIMVDD